MEAEAYVAWIQGTLNFELSLWKAAAENLKHAQVVYENLLNALPEEEQTLYKAKVSISQYLIPILRNHSSLALLVVQSPPKLTDPICHSVSASK